MEHKSNKELSAEERLEVFADVYGNDIDVGMTLAAVVRAVGDLLADIMGPERADGGMQTMVQSLEPWSDKDWRTLLEENASNCFSEWPLGVLFHDLTAYAYFGVALWSEEDVGDAEIEEVLGTMIKKAEAFLRESPVRSVVEEDHDLNTLVLLATNRWALDHMEPVEPAALARFGGVSEGRMRNMISAKDGKFTRTTDGRIPAAQALEWLAGRDEFYNSIWRDQERAEGTSSGEILEEPVFVPVARDGSVFHPGLTRNGTYTVGPKGDEKHLADYTGALQELQRMPRPYWRRPNDQGGWGVVRGIEWKRFEKRQLERHSGSDV